MPDIKEKPKSVDLIKEKVKAAPKELVRRGLSSGADRLRDQLRDGGRQDQREDLGQTQLEDGIHQGARCLEQGGQRLLQKTKTGMVQSRNGKGGKSQPDSRSDPTSPSPAPSVPSSDTPQATQNFQPVPEDTLPRIKTREAYYERQTVSATPSEAPIRGREQAVKKVVRERRNESGKASQTGTVPGSPVSAERTPFAETGSVSAEVRGQNHAVRERRISGVTPSARRSVSGSAAGPEPTTIKGQITARHSGGRSASAASGGRPVGRNTRQTVGRGAKQAVKGRKQAVPASKTTAQAAQAAARKVHAVGKLTGSNGGWAAKAAGRGAKAAVQAGWRTLRAMAAAAKGMLTALAAGGSVCVIVVVVLCLVGLLVASPFGILFAGESGGPDAVPVSAAVAQVNYDLNTQLESLQTGTFDRIEIVGQPPAWDEVLAAFAVYVAGGDSAVDVATMDTDRVARLKAVFWDMTALSSSSATVDHPDTNPSDAVDDSYSETVLTITITASTAAEMAVAYGFDQEQMDTLNELLSQEDMLLELAGETGSISGEARELIQALPVDLSPERKAVVKAACSLVGKVNYFWGGKSLIIGWDSRWGTLQKVWAEGSPTTGNYRPYGLDCSGMVDWVFYNTTNGAYVIGHGGGASAQHSYCTDIGWDEALPGDLVFYPADEHVGIVGGRDESGNLLVIHCASGHNNVVITGIDGFVAVARPDFYEN